MLIGYLVFLVIASLYSQIYDICVYFLFSNGCDPLNISAEWASFFAFIDYVISFQAWMIPLLIYFKPAFQVEYVDEDYEYGANIA